VLGLPESKIRVGQANVDFALDILQRQQIPITAQDIAGEGYRYLRFDLTNGDVWVRRGHGVMHEMEKVPAVRAAHAGQTGLNKERP
jgi:chemotaxis protein CheD